MTERSTVQALSTLGTARKPGQDESRRAKLGLSWAIDPATGKPAARWVIERTESAKIVAFSSAA
jgi:hypothetical protein